jgi:predicted TIM-barrel fold metal-dependent hydrolase
MDAGAPIELVDAHHHLWDLRAGRYPWLQQAPDPHFFLGDHAALRRDYLPDDYRRDAAGHRVLATVHCEAEWARDDPVAETAWLTRVHAAHGFPNAIVAWAPFDRPDSAELLARQAAFPLVRGIRCKPATARTPDALAPGAPGTMQDPRWLDGFARLAGHGLSWDLRVPPWHLAEAARVAADFPSTPIVLEHTGFPWDRSEAGLAAWRRGMEALAREPNVRLKVSELGLRDAPWDAAANRRVVREAIAIFGIGRCMFASNAPVSGLRIGWDAQVRAIAAMLDDLDAADRHRFFVANAVAFYRIALPAAPVVDALRPAAGPSSARAGG